MNEDSQGVNEDSQGVNEDSQGVNEDSQVVNQDSQVVNQDSQVVNQDSQAVTTTENDHELAKEALNKIREIVSGHCKDAMIEAGEYIIKTFYDGDYEKAKQKKPSKEAAFKSLHALIIKKRQEDSSAPSKSWIYNAVNLACDAEALKNFEPYGDLSPSHQILLLPVDDMGEKKEYIQKVSDKNMSVNALREELSSNKPKRITVISELDLDELKKLDVGELESLKEKAERKIEEFNKKLEIIDKALSNQSKEDSANPLNDKHFQQAV